MLNAATTHYTRTLARPGTALPSRPLPLSGSSAQWDSLTGNICELVANVASANSDAQRAFAQGGAVRSLIDLVPLLTASRAMTVAQNQPSLTFATEQVLLAASTLIWCTPQSQSMLLEAGTIVRFAHDPIDESYRLFSHARTSSCLLLRFSPLLWSGAGCLPTCDRSMRHSAIRPYRCVLLFYLCSSARALLVRIAVPARTLVGATVRSGRRARGKRASGRRCYWQHAAACCQ